jgi:trehalose 6-phosphate synthase/phosphatase
MFESISKTPYSSSLPSAPAIFACTVGQKPSKARYYLDDTVDVLALLQCLADASSSNLSSTETQVSFDNVVRKELWFCPFHAMTQAEQAPGCLYGWVQEGCLFW